MVPFLTTGHIFIMVIVLNFVEHVTIALIFSLNCSEVNHWISNLIASTVNVVVH